MKIGRKWYPVVLLGLVMLLSVAFIACNGDDDEATATPTPTEAATPTPTGEASPTPTGEATPTPTEAATPTPTAEATPDPIAEGSQLFTAQGCIACHVISGEAGPLGPSMAGLFGSEEELATGETVTVDREYLEESLVDPGAKVVAGYGVLMAPSSLSQSEIDALIEYIESLADAAAATPTPVAGPPQVPHTLEGRDDCTMCHQVGGGGVGEVGGTGLAVSHEGRTAEICLGCHTSAE